MVYAVLTNCRAQHVSSVGRHNAICVLLDGKPWEALTGIPVDREGDQDSSGVRGAQRRDVQCGAITGRQYGGHNTDGESFADSWTMRGQS